jgi:hypothetical protein
MGTWDATAEFKDVRVQSDGQTLYASDLQRAPTAGSQTAVNGA